MEQRGSISLKTNLSSCGCIASSSCSGGWGGGSKFTFCMKTDHPQSMGQIVLWWEMCQVAFSWKTTGYLGNLLSNQSVAFSADGIFSFWLTCNTAFVWFLTPVPPQVTSGVVMLILFWIIPFVNRDSHTKNNHGFGRNGERPLQPVLQFVFIELGVNLEKRLPPLPFALGLIRNRGRSASSRLGSLVSVAVCAWWQTCLYLWMRPTHSSCFLALMSAFCSEGNSWKQDCKSNVTLPDSGPIFPEVARSLPLAGASAVPGAKYVTVTLVCQEPVFSTLLICHFVAFHTIRKIL